MVRKSHASRNVRALIYTSLIIRSWRCVIYSNQCGMFGGYQWCSSVIDRPLMLLDSPYAAPDNFLKLSLSVLNFSDFQRSDPMGFDSQSGQTVGISARRLTYPENEIS